MQEALAKAYPRWGRILRTDQPDVYVRRVVANAAHSWWRRRSNREPAVGEPVDGPAGGDLSTDAVERDAMWRQIRRLPDRQRVVLVLRYYEDLDDATIADIMRCSQTTVRTHAARALQTLRLRLGLTEPALTGRTK